MFALCLEWAGGLKVCRAFQHTPTSSRHVLPGPISQRAQGLPVILAPGSEEDRSIQYRFSLNSVVSGRKLQAIGVVGFIGQTHWFEYGDEWVPVTSTGMTPEGLGLRRWEAAMFALCLEWAGGLKVRRALQHAQTSSRHVLPGPISQRTQSLPMISTPGSEEDRSIQCGFSLNSVVSGRKLQAIGVEGFIGQTHLTEYGDEWVPVTSTGMTPEGFGLRWWEAALSVLHLGREDGLKVCWALQHAQTSSRHVLPGPMSRRARSAMLWIWKPTKCSRLPRQTTSRSGAVSRCSRRCRGMPRGAGRRHSPHRRCLDLTRTTAGSVLPPNP